MQSQPSQPQQYNKIMEQNKKQKKNGELGRGSFSKVYKYTEGSITYAVKIITKSYFSIQEDFKKLMAYETGSLTKLKGKTCNIVNLCKYIEDQKYLYLHFQYCANGTLWELVGKEKGLQEKKAIHFLFQIVKALLVLHQQKIIHRDIKPNNIFLTQDNVIKVGDFGYAKQCYDNIRVSAVGTPEFKSPQLLICNCSTSSNFPNTLAFGQVTDKLDIWSLGVTFFYMIFNKLPWPMKQNKQSKKSISQQQLDLIKQNPIQKLLQIQQQKKPISQATRKFIIGCLQYEQKDRLSYGQIREHNIFSTVIAQKIIALQRQIIKKNKWDIERILEQIGKQKKKQWNQLLNVKELEIVLKKINGSIDYPKIMAIYQTYQERLSLQFLAQLLGESKKIEKTDENFNVNEVNKINRQDDNANKKMENQDFQYKIVIKKSYIEDSPKKPSQKFQKRRNII